MRIWAFTLVAAATFTQFSKSAQSDDAGFVVKFNVDLIQVDALVTDSSGRHVADLKAGDFEVVQDDRPQRITHFSYVEGARPDAREHITFTSGAVPRNEVNRIFALVFDDTVVSFSDFRSTQTALLRFVDEGMRDGDMAAIVRTSAGSGALQMFTFDRAWLHETIRRFTWRPPVPVCCVLLPTLIEAIHAMVDYPGRKSIILLSCGTQTDHWYDAATIADAASRASVMIQTIDVRGLLPPQSGTNYHPGRGADASYSAASHDAPSADSITAWATNHFESQNVLSYLAEMTTGRFQHDRNDIYRELMSAADDTQGYYLIGWYPRSKTFAARPGRPEAYHHIKLRVRGRKGLTIRAREGFFAWPSSGPRPVHSPARQTLEALFSPFKTNDIDVRMTAAVKYDEHFNAYIDSLLHVFPNGIMFHEVPGQSNCKEANLEFLSTPMPLDPEKEPTGRINAQRSTLRFCGSELVAVLERGFAAEVREGVLTPGPYQMRMAVRNIAASSLPSIGFQGFVRRDETPSDRTLIGSASEIVEVPDLNKQAFALSGITVWSGSGQLPKSVLGSWSRPAAAGDPAVRQFRQGETIRYLFSVAHSARKSTANLNLKITIIYEGNVIFESEPRSAETGDTVEGWYQLPESLEPGRYLLGVSIIRSGARSPQLKEWADFEVTKDPR